MRVVIEAGVGHPTFGHASRCDAGQGTVSGDFYRVALFTRFTPQKFLGVGRTFRNPLCGRKDAHGGQKRFTRQVTLRVANNANFRRVRGDIRLEFAHQESVDHIRLVVRHADIEVFVEC